MTSAPTPTADARRRSHLAAALVAFVHAAWLALALAPGLVAPANAEEFRFTVLHTTDLHGALTSFDYLNDRPAARGLAKISTLVGRARAEGRPVLLLDNGDALTGGPLETVYRAAPRTRPDPMIAAMNRIGYDAMAVGNHEFDLLPDERERTRREASFPWLAANVADSAGGRAPYAPSFVRDLGGVRVGIVGVCTPAVPVFEDAGLVRGLAFRSPLEAATAEAARLRAEGRCDVVVLLAHTGLERESANGRERGGDTPNENWAWRLANEVPGVDAVIAGHTHTVVPALRAGRAVVTQAGKWGEQLGRIDFTLTREAAGAPWQVAAFARVLAITDSVPDDSAIVALAAPYHDAARASLGEVVGEASETIGSPNGRFADGPVLDLIHRVQRWQTEAEVSLAALPDPGASLARGPIRRRDLYRLYPYDNTLVVVELTGAELKRALEHAAEYFQTYTFEHARPLAEPGRPGYNFDLAEGVEYRLDLTQPAGRRVVGLSRGGAPLADDARLRVVVNSYRANGAGGYDAIAAAPRVGKSAWQVHDLLVEWVRARRTINAEYDANWRIVPEHALVPERPYVDLLVRRGSLDAAETVRLDPAAPALRGEVAYWLARAWGWREQRRSSAFTDVPDSLAPWLDGLLRRGALGRGAEAESFRPHAPATLPQALDWAAMSAAKAGLSVARAADRASFRRSLLTGLRRAPGAAEPEAYSRRELTRAEALAIVANARWPQLRVLETTDFHGAILPGAPDRRSGRSAGGSAVLAAHVEKLRAENPEGTILLDGGDCFQGTMISNLQFGVPVVEQMNALGYQAFAIGNHEFDWTADTLETRVRAMRFAALGANMIERKTNRRPKWVRADTAFVRRGLPVGVVGLCYRYTPTVTLPAYVRHLRFEDDSLAALKAVTKLRRVDRSKLVFGVGHVPAENDSLRRARSGDLVRLARGVPGVTAWFGGHSHNQVLDEVNGVPVMIAGSHGQFVAVLDLVVDGATGAVAERRARLQQTWSDEVAVDSAWTERVARWNSHVRDVAGRRIGTNARALGRNRGGESAVGDLVTDAMRAASGVDVALQNPGGLRADLPAGEITRGSIYEIMPFDNTIVTLELTGAELRATLEEGLRYGRVTQVSGLRFRFDVGRPEMQRLIELTLADGSPLDPAKTYKVAANNFMATGGDNYATLAKGRNVVDTGFVIRGALEQYVTAKTKDGAPLDVREDGRIRREGRAETEADRR